MLSQRALLEVADGTQAKEMAQRLQEMEEKQREMELKLKAALGQQARDAARIGKLRNEKEELQAARGAS